MSLHMLNCPKHMFRKMSKQEILHNSRTNSASTITKNPVTGSLFCQPNAVGIIGGVSADVSLNFDKKLVKYSSEGKEDGNALPFVLCSDPIINKNLLRHDDSSQLNDHTLIVENLIDKRVYLEKSGVCCIVMPCHVSHLWYDEVSKGCSVPVLHMGECVAKELKEAKLKPIEAGSPLQIGVIASNAI